MNMWEVVVKIDFPDIYVYNRFYFVSVSIQICSFKDYTSEDDFTSEN